MAGRRSTSPRELDVLLMIVGAVDGVPLREDAIAEAYKVGAITGVEGKALQRFNRLSPRGRKAMAMQARDVTDAQLAKMRAKLDRAAADLQAHVERRKGSSRP